MTELHRSTETLQLTRVWAAATGLALIVLMAALVATGHALSQALPMLVAAIVGYEMAMTGYDFWRRRRNG